MLHQIYKNICIISLFFILNTSLAFSFEGTFKVCTEQVGNPPYLIKNKNENENSGIIVDILVDSFQQINLKLKFVKAPWKRCLALLRNNQVHSITPAIWTKDRSLWASYPDDIINSALWNANYRVFIHKDSSTIFNNGVFSNLKYGLGAPPGYVVAHKLKKMNILSKAKYSARKGLSLVLEGRSDGYVVEENIGLHYIKELKAQKKIIMLNDVFLSTHWHLPVSKQFYSKYPSLTNKIWQSIKENRIKAKKILTKKLLK